MFAATSHTTAGDGKGQLRTTIRTMPLRALRKKYGGDGQEKSDPNSTARVPLHNGQGPIARTISRVRRPGEASHRDTQQMPIHNHAFLASQNIAQNPQPTDSVVATSNTVQLYIGEVPAATPLDAQTLQPVGGNQPHDNMMPYLVIGFIVSLFGIFPPPQ